MSSSEVVVTPVLAESLIGRVKWFNNKAGYGFVTITDGSRSGTDVFVHHSSVQVENQQYKYLVQGEYVEFDLIKTTTGSHEWQASNVHGIKGGKLMCETRNETKMARNTYKSASQPDATLAPRQPRPPREPRSARQPRPRADAPREGDKKEWTLVPSNAPLARGKPRAPRQSETDKTK
jgi:cold shock CspA family protein